MISPRLYELRTKYLGEDFHFDRLHPIRFYKVTFYKDIYGDIPFSLKRKSISILIATDDLFSCFKYVDGEWITITFQYWDYLKGCNPLDTKIVEVSEKEAEKLIMLQELAR